MNLSERLTAAVQGVTMMRDQRTKLTRHDENWLNTLREMVEGVDDKLVQDEDQRRLLIDQIVIANMTARLAEQQLESLLELMIGFDSLVTEKALSGLRLVPSEEAVKLKLTEVGKDEPA